jgi:hypothetical protein
VAGMTGTPTPPNSPSNITEDSLAMLHFNQVKEIDLKLIDLFIKEFEYLKLEARDAISESRLIERNALIASAAVWAWFYAQPTRSAPLLYLKFIPLLLCLLGFLRAYALHVRLRRISEYVSLKEKQFGGNYTISWETHLNKMPWLLTTTSATFWVIVCCLNGWAAYAT